MTDQLFPVPFHDDTLVLVDHDGTPFVAMKPVVINMGLAWEPQFTKLKERFEATITEIVMVAEDGKLREMLCLPLRKLPAWLYSVNPNKVAPELRDKIVRYQEECDEALWNYWTKGHAHNPRAAAPTIAQQMAVHKMRLSLLDRLQRETHPEKREAIHQQLAHVSRLLNLPTPDKDKIGGDADPHRRRLPAGSHRSPVPSLAVWAGECLTPETGHWTHIGTAASNADTHLYPHYLRWCRASGDESMTLRRFRAELVATLRAAGHEVIETRRETGQGLQGIRIKSDATPEDMFGVDTGLNTS